jgi:hypothetical protein
MRLKNSQCCICAVYTQRTDFKRFGVRRTSQSWLLCLKVELTCIYSGTPLCENTV